LNRRLVLGRKGERLLGVAAPQEVVDPCPHGRVVGNLEAREVRES
jgi:hypothetical protein